MSEWLCVVGQDARQQAAARALRQAGVAVAGPEQAGQAPVILLPMGAAGARAEACRAAVQAAAGAAGYCTLEYDLAYGRRGRLRL